MSERPDAAVRPAAAPGAAPARARGPVVLQARHLTRKYRMGQETIEVLRGVSLDLHAGESVAIMGRSGAGKSTLLHLLGLLDRPDGGSLRMDGVESAGLSRAGRARMRNATVCSS